jgi:hypothetical protein
MEAWARCRRSGALLDSQLVFVAGIAIAHTIYRAPDAHDPERSQRRVVKRHRTFEIRGSEREMIQHSERPAVDNRDLKVKRVEARDAAKVHPTVTWFGRSLIRRWNAFHSVERTNAARLTEVVVKAVVAEVIDGQGLFAVQLEDIRWNVLG